MAELVGAGGDDEEDEEEEQEERWLHLCLLPSECEGQSASKLYPEPYILILKTLHPKIL